MLKPITWTENLAYYGLFIGERSDLLSPKVKVKKNKNASIFWNNAFPKSKYEIIHRFLFAGPHQENKHQIGQTLKSTLKGPGCCCFSIHNAWQLSSWVHSRWGCREQIDRCLYKPLSSQRRASAQIRHPAQPGPLRRRAVKLKCPCSRNAATNTRTNPRHHKWVNCSKLHLVGVV